MEILWDVNSQEWAIIEKSLKEDLESFRDALETKSDRPGRDDELRGKIAYIRGILSSAQEAKEKFK